jgi:hypothetical protein
VRRALGVALPACLTPSPALPAGGGRAVVPARAMSGCRRAGVAGGAGAPLSVSERGRGRGLGAEIGLEIGPEIGR